MTLFAVITLGVASGYACYVWSGEAHATWRQHRQWKAIGYGMLGLANLIDLTIIGFSLAGRPFDLPRGAATILLFTIIAVPAFTVHRARRTSTKIIDGARRRSQ